MILSCLRIASSSGKGKGVFTTKKITANTVLEISPVLIFSVEEVASAENTLLYNYLFEWGEEIKQRALGLGFVSMYNHSYTSNCDYEMDYEKETIKIVAIKDIEKGVELFINYNADPNDKTLVWFHKNKSN